MSARAEPALAVRPAVVESLEPRRLFVASFDVTHLTQLREDQQFVDVDGSDVAVAVLDTGVYASNPDLQANVVAWYNAVEDPIDTPLPTGGGVDRAFDTSGHGTHVAGIAASSDPSIGVAYAAKVVAVKVIADAGGPQLGGNPLLRGLKWVRLHAQDLNIRVVNLSLGTGGNIDAVGGALLRNEVTRAIDDLEAIGVTVVAASGNSYAQYVEPGAAFPAAVSTISVANTWAGTGLPEDFVGPVGGPSDRYLAVEGTVKPDQFASTSQRSTLPNQVAAPGQDVYSLWNGFVGDGDGLHKIQSGTSMSAPFVSGLVALMQDAARTFGGQYLADPNQILKILQDTADTVTDANVPDNKRYDTVSGDLSNLPETGRAFKRVDAYAAIKRVYDLVTAGNPGPNPGDGAEADTDSVRGRATIVPTLNATRTFDYVGNVGTDGQVQVGENDVDLYRVTLQTRGNLTITTRPPADVGFPFDATLRLFNAAGTEIARADGDPVTFDYPVLTTDPAEPLATGVYYVGISSQLNTNYNIVTGAAAADGMTTGDYFMSIALSNPDPNGVAQGAVDADLTNPTEAIDDPGGGGGKVTVNRFQGLLGSDRPIIGSEQRIAVDADVDMFRVIAPDDGVLHVDAKGKSLYGADGADTYVKVYDEDLNLVGQNDDASATDPDSRLDVTVDRGGVYYVAVTVFANRSFNASDPYNSRTPNSTPTDKSYDLLLWATNGDTNGTTVTATDVAAGTTVSGTVGTDSGKVGDGKAPSKDVDWFRVVAPADGYLQFEVAGAGGFVPSMSLWQLSPTGTQATKIDQLASATGRLAVRASAGDVLYAAVTGQGNDDFNWFAVASGPGGATGAYTLTAAALSPESAKKLIDNSVRNNTPGTLLLGQPVTGNLGRDGDVVIGPADVDLYAFTPESDVAVRFRTVSNAEEDADTVLRLFDAKGKQIAANDNATANGKASRVSASLRKGQTYYVGVSGAGPGAFGYDPLTGADAADGSTGRYQLVAERMAPGSASLSFSGKAAGVFTDADGKRVTLRLSGPGVGQLEIDGAVPGSFVLTLDDVGADTVLTVKGRTTFGDVRVNGPVRAIRAAGVRLAGELDVEGTLGELRLGSADAGSVVTANLIETVRVGGDFAGALQVSGDVGTFRAGGDLTAGGWEVAGGVLGLTARDATIGWTATLGGQVNALRLRTMAGSLTASQVGTVTVAGAVAEATLTTTVGGIDAFSAGTLSDSTVRSAGDIGRVTVGSSTGSRIFAGVGDAVTDLPADGSAFAAPAGVRALTVKGVFADTVVAAQELGPISLRGVTTDNAGRPFGLATTSLASLVLGRTRVYRSGDDRAALAPRGDFVVRLVEAVEQPPPVVDPPVDDGTT
ncbi:MAG TPA: S8 family serine peptidase [Humisphaera sp.]